MALVQSELKKIYIRVDEQIPDYLCFTANTANSGVMIDKTWSPTAVTLETSTDGTNWTPYTFNYYITLSNIWDKLYFRNTSETATGFSIHANNYYRIKFLWDISASWDVTSLLCKTLTDRIIADKCFCFLFYSNSSLRTPPKLPATTLTTDCYYAMFQDNTNLEVLPELPATILADRCYQQMFKWCSKIKLSETQTWEYQTPYRIPTTWTGTAWSNSLRYMFTSTWWITSDPTINTTYYTSNTLV